MGIFSRFRDIVNSNISAMLEKAEDPEKLVKLMIQEMEDTLVEIKASCAGTMASATRIQRALGEGRERAVQWEAKAKLAISKGREDLAREAIIEKQKHEKNNADINTEMEQLAKLVNTYKSDIKLLEDKLESARKKHRVLVQRHIHVSQQKKARNNIRKVDTADAMLRFEKFENRIERMEADSDLINYGRKPTLEDKFDLLEKNEEVEKELESLRSEVSKQASPEML